MARKKQPKWQLQNSVTISEFAQMKKVHRSTVYRKIDAGGIIPAYVGVSKTVYIDLDQYQELEFETNRGNHKNQSS